MPLLPAPATCVCCGLDWGSGSHGRIRVPMHQPQNLSRSLMSIYFALPDCSVLPSRHRDVQSSHHRKLLPSRHTDMQPSRHSDVQPLWSETYSIHVMQRYLLPLRHRDVLPLRHTPSFILTNHREEVGVVDGTFLVGSSLSVVCVHDACQGDAKVSSKDVHEHRASHINCLQEKVTEKNDRF